MTFKGGTTPIVLTALDTLISIRLMHMSYDFVVVPGGAAFPVWRTCHNATKMLRCTKVISPISVIGPY